ncbi:hypothetical protein XaclCFBP3371_12275 [Xanthomonas euvesicatoria pv. citrumelonis]|nr:hypothetical protein XaclCFBP3371_12275 [Xanthomonas euvesicatoria pv. citrumelonis]
MVEGIDDSIYSRTGQPLLRFPIPDSRFPIPDSRIPNPKSQIPNPKSRIPASLPHRQYRDLLAIVIQLLGAHDQ